MNMSIIKSDGKYGKKKKQAEEKKLRQSATYLLIFILKQVFISRQPLIKVFFFTRIILFEGISFQRKDAKFIKGSIQMCPFSFISNAKKNALNDKYVQIQSKLHT